MPISPLVKTAGWCAGCQRFHVAILQCPQLVYCPVCEDHVFSLSALAGHWVRWHGMATP